ncbi:MAG: hypothetical protein V1873_01875 [Verrucomicrobiota bacterium]
MMRRFLALLLLAWPCTVRAQTATNLIQLQRQAAAFSVNPPHEQRGYFAAGAQLQVLGPATGGTVRVRCTTSDGRIIEALCRAADLGSAPPTPSASPSPVVPRSATVPVGRTVPGSIYENPEWLEDSLGHKLAVEAQARFDVKMIVFFYADWNEECELLWKELLSDREFRRQTRNLIKVRINPEHGKAEGLLARYYRLRKYPTTFVVRRPHAEPKYVDLTYYSFGKLRVSKLDYAIADILAAGTTNMPAWRHPSVTNQPPTP